VVVDAGDLGVTEHMVDSEGVVVGAVPLDEAG
jgi:hypothetical protein